MGLLWFSTEFSRSETPVVLGIVILVVRPLSPVVERVEVPDTFRSLRETGHYTLPHSRGEEVFTLRWDPSLRLLPSFTR